MVDAVSHERPAPRRLSGLLLVGLLVYPLVFVWFLLRRGYSNQLRLAGFCTFGVDLALRIVWALDPAIA